MKRYNQTGYCYAKYYLVECPECDEPARVESGKLNCPNCMLHKDADDQILMRISI